MPKQWQTSLDLIQKYWQSYGGLPSLLKSPYFHIALLLTAMTVGFWRDGEWWQHNLSILPNLLGFTLGGLAVFLCLGSDNLRIAMMQSDTPDVSASPYMKVIGSFVHFVMVQTLAIVIGVLANAASATAKPGFINDDINCLLGLVVGFLGYGLFLYSLMLTLALTLSIYKMSLLSAKVAQK